MKPARKESTGFFRVRRNKETIRDAFKAFRPCVQSQGGQRYMIWIKHYPVDRCAEKQTTLSSR